MLDLLRRALFNFQFYKTAIIKFDISLVDNNIINVLICSFFYVNNFCKNETESRTNWRERERLKYRKYLLEK